MKKDEKREMLIDMVEKYLDADQLEKFKSSFNSESKKTFIKQKKYTFSLDEINNLGLKQIDEQNYSYKNEIKISHSLLYNLGVIYPLDYSSSYIIKAIKDYLPSYPLVLDMCAAPGGKSISLSFLKEDALITSYDISYSRVLEMIKNVDRSGLNNIFINSIDPLKLNYFETFDFIILDAPCSGSGMFRKEEKMLDDLTEKKIQKLLPIQKDLLKKAVTMVKKGGYILYSTCSFSIDEDEKQVEIEEEPVVLAEPEVKQPNVSDHQALDTYVGTLTGYGPNCVGCSGMTSSGYDVRNTTTYVDSEFGEVRILAADGMFDFYTIVRVSNVPNMEPFIAIVLDRGGNVGFGKGTLFDLLFADESQALHKTDNVTFEILRDGK